jgi:hypothetical protein
MSPQISAAGVGYVAKKKVAKQTDASANEADAGNGQVQEKLTNKAEAMRRALGKLGTQAKPAEIQEYIKTNFDVEMSTQMISTYKSIQIRKGGKVGKRGRKPKEIGAVVEPMNAALHDAVSFKDLRMLREIRNRLGHARMRELVAWMAD